MVIARKEAREARYFLRLIDGVFLEDGRIEQEIKEATEIIRILSSMIKKAEKRNSS